MSTTAKNIFNYIQGMNPNSQTVSSIGTFVTAFSQQVADSQVSEVIQVLVNSDKKDTLAFKIASTNSKFTEKQLWVIAFELEKNQEFAQNVNNYYEKQALQSKQKAQESKDKLAANKANSQNELDRIKLAGKKLGDYYAWLKKSSFKKEFFNKKYSNESVSQFIAI